MFLVKRLNKKKEKSYDLLAIVTLLLIAYNIPYVDPFREIGNRHSL